MFHKLTITSLLLVIPFFVSAQNLEITYYEHIQPIIHKNCTPCHRPNQSAPFNLLTYDDVAKRATFIGKVTQSRYMPPFPADKKFQSYLNERGLTFGEIQTIRLWIESGMKKGKETESKFLDLLLNETTKTPDLQLKMAKKHTIEGNITDDFRYFNLPTGLKEERYIESLKFIPGNRKAVHHSRLMVDTTQQIRGIDGLSELDPQIKEFQKIRLKDDFLYGWVPGNDQISFPKGMGRKLNADADFILNIHYAPTPVDVTDQSEIQLYFAKNKIEREIETLILREDDISNQPFFLPKETTPTFYISKKIEKDISLISIMPHMHLLGKSIKAFAITPENDVINLIKIDKWDFNWQMTYQFKKLLKIPANSLLLVEATYNNTTANPANPNYPAQDVGYGWGTKDEMLNLVMYYVPYQTNDENRQQEN
jgi:Copper type II ascorbate-dependent monooxygenase, C-terminal domain